MDQHIPTAFDDDLGELRGCVAAMGGLAERAVAGAMTALGRRDIAAAEQVVAADARIDRLEQDVEQLAVRLIALRAPMADDLREVLAAMKVAGTVERIGDYAKNIARRVAELEGGDIEPISVLPAMGDMAAGMVRDALDAFAARDAAAAARVIQRDRAVDDFYDSVFRILVTYMMENPRSIGQVAHLLFVAKNLERIADHATNIAEMVHFAATGARLADRERGRAAA